jgi:rhomboid protease GluP
VSFSNPLLSTPGKFVLALVVLGLPLGYVLSAVQVRVGSGEVPLVYYFIQVNSLVYSGWPLPILSSIIVVLPDYLGVVDVFFNAVAVLFIDRLLSSTYSTFRYLATFLVGGAAGNILSLVNGPNYASFGASGGIFALIAGVVSYDYASNGRLNVALLGWFLVVLVYSSIGGSVDIFGHLGGAAVGLLMGYVFRLSEPKNPQ